MTGDLIKLLEQARGPDRELDTAIYRDIIRSGRATNHDALTPEQRASHFRDLAPRYTSSLDAALSLVPGGWAWMVAVSPSEEGPAGASLWVDPGHHNTVYAEHAATASLALCVGALKARAKATRQ